jgi:hypothetical protein
MINVEWTTFNRPNLAGGEPIFRSGWTFKDKNDVICRNTREGKECISWREYARWNAEENGSVSRLWINNRLAWQYEQGWIVSLDEIEKSLT